MRKVLGPVEQQKLLTKYIFMKEHGQCDVRKSCRLLLQSSLWHLKTTVVLNMVSGETNLGVARGFFQLLNRDHLSFLNGLNCRNTFFVSLFALRETPSKIQKIMAVKKRRRSVLNIQVRPLNIAVSLTYKGVPPRERGEFKGKCCQ